jgi:hypothetical protein
MSIFKNKSKETPILEGDSLPVPVEKYGIDKLKLLLSFIIILGTDLVQDLKDGKLSIAEGFGLFKDVIPLPDLISKREEIKVQLLDVSTAEAKEMIIFIEEKFDLQTDKAVKLLHYSMNILANIVDIADTVND